MTTNGDVLIRVENLQKAFGDFHALNGITEEIHKGEVVVIIGPSGSGKSTFLRSLNLLEVPTGGHIYFEGVDITDAKVDIDKHRQKMGMVFQHFNLFPHKTILENITLAPIKLLKKDKAEAEKEARVLLKRVGLEEKADSYPSQLSGGQKQRSGTPQYTTAFIQNVIISGIIVFIFFIQSILYINKKIAIVFRNS